MIEWACEIEEKAALKRRLMEVDRILTHYLPQPPASAASIADAEATLGVSLDSQYRDFLRYTDGWKAFACDAHLFGTEDLIGKSALRPFAEQMLNAFNLEGAFPDRILKNRDVVIIGTAHPELNLLLLVKAGCQKEGHVVRIFGSQLFEYSSFYEFYRSTVDEDLHLIECAIHGR